VSKSKLPFEYPIKPRLEEVFLPQKRNYQGGVVRIIVADAKKDKEKKRVQKVVAEASLDVDLAKAIEVLLLFSWSCSFS
jgi:hypothetical protein